MSGFGLLVGLSALWMTLSSPRAAGTGDLFLVFRLLFGTAMVWSVAAGIAAIRRGDVPTHRAWMMRAYAIGLGAGTQVLTLGFGEAIAGHPPMGMLLALLMGGGWAINLAVAETVIRTRPVADSREGMAGHRS